MPRRGSHPIDVSVFTGIGQWVLRVEDTTAQCPHEGERTVADAHSPPPYQA